MKFSLSKKMLERMIEHARKEYPFEACGILAGKNGEAKEVYPLQNEEKSEVSYFASPKEQIKVFKEMRKEGLKLTGIYHSHPNSSAKPSQRDIELAFYPEAVYLIVSLKSYKAPVVKAYNLGSESVEEVEIVLGEDSDANKDIY